MTEITDEELGRAMRTVVKHLRSDEVDGPDSQGFYERQIVRFASAMRLGEWKHNTPIKRTQVIVEPTEEDGTPLGVLELLVEWITGKPVGALGVPSQARAVEIAGEWLDRGAKTDAIDLDALGEGFYERLLMLSAWLRTRMRGYAVAAERNGYAWDRDSMAEWIYLDLDFDKRGSDVLTAQRLCEFAGYPTIPEQAA